MDTEREHMAPPAEHRERGLALWVGLALGFAGIIVTVGGIYEWNARKVGRPTPVATTPSVHRMPGEDAEIVMLRRQLDEERRARIAAESRAFQQEQEASRNRPRRCIDGVRFEQFGREWRNVGRC